MSACPSLHYMKGILFVYFLSVFNLALFVVAWVIASTPSYQLSFVHVEIVNVLVV